MKRKLLQTQTFSSLATSLESSSLGPASADFFFGTFHDFFLEGFIAKGFRRGTKNTLLARVASLELPRAYRAVEVGSVLLIGMKKLMLTVHLKLLNTAWSNCIAT